MEYVIHLLALFIALNFLLKWVLSRWECGRLPQAVPFLRGWCSVDDGTVQDRGGYLFLLPPADV